MLIIIIILLYFITPFERETQAVYPFFSQWNKRIREINI